MLLPLGVKSVKIYCYVIRAMGFPPEFFTVLFAIPRMAGYLAHWRESLDDPDTKIMRPQQVTSLVYEILHLLLPCSFLQQDQ